MKKKKLKNKAEESKAEEPLASYAGKRIKFFNSIEEENEYKNKIMSEMTPKENIENVVRLIKSIYKEKLRTKLNSDKKIYFKKLN